VIYYSTIRHGGAEAGDDPTASPLRDTDFSGLPPTLAIAAECDPLADDAVAYAARLRAAGVPAHAVVEAGLVHGYLRARSSVPRAAASFARITAAIAALARGQLPEET
jgi:acetyl esterase